jgi:HAD superfamily hydrolase (TIGR01490 family)
MDHTLVNNDCDVSWKHFLIDRGLAPATDLELIDFFYEQYSRGVLDDTAFVAFQLREFVGRGLDEIRAWSQQHFDERVRDLIYEGAMDRLRGQIRTGDRVCLLTATNRFIAEPVAAYCGFEDLIATDLEIVDGRFTGKIEGAYCIAEGKVERLTVYCNDYGASPADASYYGDSIADIPVLTAVGYPVAANPVPRLREEADFKGWQVVDF